MSVPNRRSLVLNSILGIFAMAAVLQPIISSAQEAPVYSFRAWTAADEKRFGEFVTALGESGCTNINSCLKSSANPFRATDGKNDSFWTDCAKFPYLLRAYFAAKNGLPFSYVSDVAAVGNSSDTRYSDSGNIALKRSDFNSSKGGLISALNELSNSVNSSMYRFHPRHEVDNSDVKPTNGMDLERSRNFFDFYPVEINRTNVRPGTLIYDPNGHVAIVYKVESDGRVRFVDAHPKSLITRGVYGEKFARSRPGMGAGFKNWRPLVQVTKRVNGQVETRILTLPTKGLPGHSFEQFYGTQPALEITSANYDALDKVWKKGAFVHNGAPLDYYDFVRTRLAIGDLKYHPVEELKNGMEALCNDVQDRVVAVEKAIEAGINKKQQPKTLPKNIYGTDGEWEDFSSPSRDARLKTSFLELRARTEQFVKMYNERSPRIIYDGTNLQADLANAYLKLAQSPQCTFAYRNSSGQQVKISYDEASKRLFKFSFDPYHCPELRWGASGSELSSCDSDSIKRSWYDAEQGLRNQLERTYDADMSASLSDLSAGVNHSGQKLGVQQAPDVDLRGFLGIK